MHSEIAFNEEKLFSLDEFLDEEWQKLAPHEKALAMNYKRQIKLGMKIDPILMNSFSAICEKHPDFHIGCIP